MAHQNTYPDPRPSVPSPRSDAVSATPSSAVDTGEPLSRRRLTDVDRAGGKSADLGEMLGAGFPVADRR